MMGIDSLSRLNLIRAMPRTTQTFFDGGWFELRGYNKVKYKLISQLLIFLIVM